MAEKLLKFIRVSSRTHERLRALGRKGETFNDIIERLLDFWEAQQHEARGAEPRRRHDNRR